MTATALDGLRVLDLSRILAAPLAAQMLGDLGAEVIKVEQPERGDDARQYGPPFAHGPDGEPMAAFFLSCNRNKRSVTLDFTTERGRELLLDLVGRCDVLLENFRPGVLERHGLGWDQLHERYPSLVMCSVTGFGQDGPYRARAGYDGIFQALSGMMGVSGLPEGVPGAGPMKSGLSLDRHPHRAVPHHRRPGRRCGIATAPARASYLDVSLLDCGIASLSHYAAELSRQRRGAAAARQRRLRRHPLAGLHLRRRAR